MSQHFVYDGLMKLDNYLREHGLTSAQFAEKAGLMGKQSVHHYRHGLRFPTPENLRRIREATNGAVTAEDFVNQHAGESPPFAPPVVAPKPRSKRVRPTEPLEAAD
jgi:transcriptional regulator with XRE-family HTH domain